MEHLTDEELRVINIACQTAQFHILTCDGFKDYTKEMYQEVYDMWRKVKEEQSRRSQ